jgi:hypothetical protein
MKTVVAIYRTEHQAEAAVRALLEEGVPRDRISFAAPRPTGRPGEIEAHDADQQLYQGVRHERGEQAAKGATLGGVGGAILGLVAFSIPGIGPAIGIGPIAVAAAGTAVGAVGGLLGALVGRGVPRRAARVIEEGVVGGYMLVGVDAPAEEARSIESILERFDPVDTGLGDADDTREAFVDDLDERAEAGARTEAERGYDEAVLRMEGGPDPATYSSRAVAVDDVAEDRYDEASDANLASRGVPGFGRTLGAETSKRESARAGDLNATSDLGVMEASGVGTDEALEPGSDVRVLPVGDEELMPPPFDERAPGTGRHDAPWKGEVAPARADDDLDVNLQDEVLHGEAVPEAALSRPEDVERATTTQGTDTARREGVEPDEERLPSPTGR